MRRDRLTWTFYGCFVAWGWFLYSFNPSVPLLADELGISDAQAGLHGTAMAVGAIAASWVAPRLVARAGRRTAVVVGLVLVAAGVLALVLARSLAVSLPAVAVLALGGNVAIAASQAGLAQHHGPAASAAVTEANGVGSSIGLVGPLAAGACVAIGWGWRPAVAVTIAITLLTAWAASRLPVGGAMTPPAVARTRAPRAEPRLVPVGGTAHGPVDALAPVEDRAVAPVDDLPDAPDEPAPRSALAAWCFLAAVVAAIALENITTYWSTDLVREQTAAGAGIATATTAGFVAGVSGVRFLVGPLSLRVRPAMLLAASFAVTIAGWAVLWTASSSTVAVVGLVIAGFGCGVQYPLSIALLLSTAPQAQDAAQARATLAGGLAIGVAPFLLGALADAVGVHTAFLVLPAVALLGGVVALVGGRLVAPTPVR
ncbi:MFS transporter [Cellulomonas uda]|uniref:Major facilitator superfamily (MFS) profile domain-containing protein n=1 Tax=Cellulomonas uda TaxID=1714 RepID=A0A4Y3KCE7_CELUD|nr:MFS transporter [Cellulomonas uda]NII66022.1 MFS family permease [Cellulomonas uda]GEA81054.1 hypothetical protein CUD01_14980 [Cellulomonas uda]